MAKDSPWFKFISSEFNDGVISLCSDSAVGLFTRLVSLYWSREGDLPLDFAYEKMPKSTPESWTELTKRGVVKIIDDRVVINFLDEQLIFREEVSIKGKEAAKKRWEADKAKKQKASNQAKNATPDAVALPLQTNGITTTNTTPTPPQWDKKEKEREKLDRDTSLSKKERSISTSASTKPSNPTSPPLWGSSLRADSMRRYVERLTQTISRITPAQTASAMDFYSPQKLTDEQAQAVRDFSARHPDKTQDFLAHWLFVIGYCCEDLEQGKESVEQILKTIDGEIQDLIYRFSEEGLAI